MALKEYEYKGSTYQFDDGDVPKGAVLVATKAREPQNKSRQPKSKAQSKD